jgi:hypothetical protein
MMGIQQPPKVKWEKAIPISNISEPVSEHDELLARLDSNMKAGWSPKDMGDAATAIRSLQAQVEYEKLQVALAQDNLEAERKARELLGRELFIQTKAAECLGRAVADKDADRIFFRDKAESAERRLAEVEKDGERYRWLRQEAYVEQVEYNSWYLAFNDAQVNEHFVASPENIDAAIDAARKGG